MYYSDKNESDHKSGLYSEELINELFEEYVESIYIYAFSILKDKELAKDITQEVFIRCMRNIHMFKGKSSYKTWLYKITLNLCRDYFKKKTNRMVNFPKEFFDSLPYGVTPEVKFIKNEEYQKLLDNLLAMPLKYRNVLILYYFEELQIKEISKILGIKQNTVKTRLLRGRKLLRDNQTL